jgi:uncharacterized protein YqgC (DUF456 family)
MNHARLADAFLILFFAWPIVLIVFKLICRQIKWRWLWLSVPIMSWSTVNAAVSLDYPVNGGGGGTGKLVSQLIGWFYMIPIFGILCLGFLVVEILFKKLKKRCLAASLKSTPE